MGFSTWNQFGDNINESLILDVASAMATNGLQAAGYTCVHSLPLDHNDPVIFQHMLLYKAAGAYCTLSAMPGT